MKGGTRSTTWPKGKKPPVSRPKGSKNKSTILKEAIGAKDWKDVQSFLEKEGSGKLVTELSKLSGANYVKAFATIAEYFKPKLRRVDGNLTGDITLKGAKVTFK